MGTVLITGPRSNAVDHEHPVAVEQHVIGDVVVGRHGFHRRDGQRRQQCRCRPRVGGDDDRSCAHCAAVIQSSLGGGDRSHIRLRRNPPRQLAGKLLGDVAHAGGWHGGVPRTNVRSSRSKNRLDVSSSSSRNVPAKNGRMSRSTASIADTTLAQRRSCRRFGGRQQVVRRTPCVVDGHRCKTRLVLHAADGSECRRQRPGRAPAWIGDTSTAASIERDDDARCQGLQVQPTMVENPPALGIRGVVELEPAIQQEAVDIVGAYPATDVVRGLEDDDIEAVLVHAIRSAQTRQPRAHDDDIGAVRKLRAVDHQGTLPTAPRAAPLDLWTSKPVDNRRRSTANSVSLVVCRTSRFPATSSIDSSASGAPARYGPRIRLRVGPPSR